MSDLSSLIAFVERFVSSISTFTSAIFDFMTYEVPIWDITIFEVILGGGVAVYLGTAIGKWLVDIVS